MRGNRIGLAAIVACTLSVAGTAGCGERTGAPDRSEEEGWDEGAAGAAVPARYLTTYAFAAAEPGGMHLYARLANETSPARLVRDYRAWTSGPAGWRSLLSLRDTLPVPRAAWRVLPGQGFRLLVGDGSEALALVFRSGAGELRLEPGAPLFEWTGATGQREYLAPATLTGRAEARSGLLFFQQAARTPGAEGASGPDRVFLLTTPAGDGLLVAENAGPAAHATAWSWLEEVRGTWSDVRVREEESGGPGVEPASDGEGADPATGVADADPPARGVPGRRVWVLELPDAGMSGRVWTIAPAGRAPPGPPAPGEPAVEPVAGELVVRDQTLPLRGLSVRIPLP